MSHYVEHRRESGNPKLKAYASVKIPRMRGHGWLYRSFRQGQREIGKLSANVDPLSFSLTSVVEFPPSPKKRREIKRVILLKEVIPAKY